MFSKEKIEVFLLLFFVTLTGSFIVGVQASPTTWVIETVDAALYVGWETSIALDSGGFPHIGYYDLNWKDLKYARWTGVNWIIGPVDTVGDVGEALSLALDSNDLPHISYHDYTNDDLRYARWTGSTWSIETVDSTGNIVLSTSLALDSNDNPHISYYGFTNDDLRYARWTGSTWSIETVDSTSNLEGSTSLALDSNNNPHISYHDYTNSDLRYARWTGSTWSIETVDSTGNVGMYTSLALDSNDLPHISYYDSTNDDLKYARWTGSTWSIETVDSTGDVGMSTSLALDSNDNPHISYRDFTNDDLRYARWTGSTWSIETVDSTGDVGMYTSLALDSNDLPHISYQDYTNFNLKYAATSNEYFSTVDVILHNSDSDGYNDAVEVIINADTSYSGTMTVSVYAYLLGPQGYPPLCANSTSWSITGTAMEYGIVWLYVPPGSPEGLYDVELNLCDDENILEDTDYEVDIYLYPPAPVLEPQIESCNFIGERKDTFDLGETVYVNGSGFAPSTGYSFYLVADQETWTNGMTIPQRVPETETSIPSNADGTIGPLPVWSNPQTAGNYDIVIDINENGQYDAGVDALDDSDIVTAGLAVIPELSSILLLLTMTILSLSTIIIKRKG